jgi:hypothetical protein
MGSNYLFLASSFTFSFPIFLAGLWLFLRKQADIRISVLTAFLWGLAFLVSPGYLFLVGFAFLYDLYERRDYRRFFAMTGTFIVTLIPFFYQVYVVLSFYAANSLGRASTFALWRGFPDPAWVVSLIRNFLAPADRAFMDWHTIAVAAIFAAATMGYIRSKNRLAFPLIALAAYLFTFYHYSAQYASRILYVFSIFATAYAVQWLMWWKRYRRMAYAAVFLLAIYSMTGHIVRTTRYYAQRVEPYATFKHTMEHIHPKLLQYLQPAKFVLASSEVYRIYIMAYFPARGLIGARSGEYFQLPEGLAEEMKADHTTLMTSTDRNTINTLCLTYGIDYAVSFSYDKAPVFRQLDGWWQKVYSDKTMTIYRRPPTITPPAAGG